MARTRDREAKERRNRRLGRWAARAAIALGWGLRLRVDDPHGVIPQFPDRPFVMALWHDGLLAALLCARRYVPRPFRLACLVSASGDGAILAGALDALGHLPVRGSSSRRASAGLLELVRVVEAGGHAVVTPDGPRGPRRQLKPGIFHLARVSGAPLLPLRVEIGWRIELRSWDRFRVPLPTSLCRVTIERPIDVAAIGDEAAAEELARALRTE